MLDTTLGTVEKVSSPLFAWQLINLWLVRRAQVQAIVNAYGDAELTETSSVGLKAVSRDTSPCRRLTAAANQAMCSFEQKR